MSNKLSENATIAASAQVHHSTLGIYSRVKDYAELRESILGDYSYISQYSIVNKTSISKFTSIAQGTYIGLWEHNTDVSTHSFYLYEHSGNFVKGYTSYNKDSIETSIGNDVWIGANSVILKGVKIGNGVIIGAGAVVTKDIPPYAIAVGNPAKIIKYRYDQKDIAWFEDLKWWDFDREKIQDIVNHGGFTNFTLFKKLLGNLN